MPRLPVGPGAAEPARAHLPGGRRHHPPGRPRCAAQHAQAHDATLTLHALAQWAARSAPAHASPLPRPPHTIGARRGRRGQQRVRRDAPVRVRACRRLPPLHHQRHGGRAGALGAARRRRAGAAARRGAAGRRGRRRGRRGRRAEPAGGRRGLRAPPHAGARRRQGQGLCREPAAGRRCVREGAVWRGGIRLSVCAFGGMVEGRRCVLVAPCGARGTQCVCVWGHARPTSSRACSRLPVTLGLVRVGQRVSVGGRRGRGACQQPARGRQCVREGARACVQHVAITARPVRSSRAGCGLMQEGASTAARCDAVPSPCHALRTGAPNELLLAQRGPGELVGDMVLFNKTQTRCECRCPLSCAPRHARRPTATHARISCAPPLATLPERRRPLHGALSRTPAHADSPPPTPPRPCHAPPLPPAQAPRCAATRP